MIPIAQTTQGFLLPMRVTPRGSRNQVLPYEDGDPWVRVKVTAIPEDGAANAAVLEVLAEVLGIAKSQIKLVRGQTARLKQFEVSGVDVSLALSRLAQAMGGEIGLIFSL